MMIVLNGPPGCGKSTLAQMYVDAHPLSLNLDIDRVRSLIGRWRDEPYQAGLLARAIALAAARTHLAAGHDVVMPQFLGRPTFLEQVERLAGEVGAHFHEIVLLDSKETALDVGQVRQIPFDRPDRATVAEHRPRLTPRAGRRHPLNKHRSSGKSASWTAADNHVHQAKPGTSTPRAEHQGQHFRGYR
jgi:predicted kinase